MKNQEMKTIPHHTRRTDSDINEDVYANVDELKSETKLPKSVNKTDPPTPKGVTEPQTPKKVSTSKSTKSRRILAALILLIIMFLIMIAFTSILLKYYLEMSKEVSELKNHENALLKDELSDLKNRNDRQRKVLEDVKSFRKDLDDIKQHFLQNIKAVETTVDITEGSCKVCPPPWKLIKSNCYYFSSTSQTWERSKELCVERNGILLVLKNEIEMNSLLLTIKQQRYWIGLKRNPEDIDRWEWADGSLLAFSAWGEGEPNNDRDNEHCAEILGGHQSWNDRPCDNNVNYICKGVWTC